MPITVNWIVLAVAGLLALSLGITVLPHAPGEPSTNGVWALAGGGTALLLASLMEALDGTGGVDHQATSWCSTRASSGW